MYTKTVPNIDSLTEQSVSALKNLAVSKVAWKNLCTFGMQLTDGKSIKVGDKDNGALSGRYEFSR